MAWGLVSSTSCPESAAGNTTSPAINTTGANLIVVHISSYSGATGLTLSDSASNTWTLIVSTAISHPESSLYYCLNPTTNASHTFTVSGSNLYCVAQISAWSGAAISGALDQSNSNTSGSGTTLQPGSVTPSLNGELVITGVSDDTPPGVFSIGSGFTILSQDAGSGNAQGGACAYLVQSTAAAINPTWTISVSQSFIAATIATFEVGSAGFTWSDLGQGQRDVPPLRTEIVSYKEAYRRRPSGLYAPL